MERVREKLYERLIRGAVNWWGGEPNFDGVAMNPRKAGG